MTATTTRQPTVIDRNGTTWTWSNTWGAYRAPGQPGHGIETLRRHYGPLRTPTCDRIDYDGTDPAAYSTPTLPVADYAETVADDIQEQVARLAAAGTLNARNYGDLLTQALDALRRIAQAA